MNKIIVTTGKAFCDIDSLACAIAYAEFLNKTGQPAIAFIPGPLNYSTGGFVKALEYKTSCPEGENKFIVVDVSDPDKFPKEVKPENVIEIFDHHSGFEKFWSDQLGGNSHIETIGACATLVWEKFVSAGIEKEISKNSAQLLSMAIIQNTLNLNSEITTTRDLMAIEALIPLAEFSENWKEKYYEDCGKTILADLETALKNDTKIEKIPGQNDLLIIGQLELWQPKNILLENRLLIEKVLKSMGSTHWMLNLLNISEKNNYILTDDPATQKFLNHCFGISFQDNLAKTERSILRKKIIKELQGGGWK